MTTTDHPATPLTVGQVEEIEKTLRYVDQATTLASRELREAELCRKIQSLMPHIRASAPSPAATGSGEWAPDVDLVGALYRCVGSATLPAEGYASAYHLGTMLNRMLAFTSERKFNRWVGYIQGVLVATGNGTVDQFKDMNRDRPDAQKAAPAAAPVPGVHAMTAIDLEGLRALLERATPAPWRSVDGDDIWDERADGQYGIALLRAARDVRNWGRKLTDDERIANAALIVAAVNALPALLALADALDIEKARNAALFMQTREQAEEIARLRQEIETAFRAGFMYGQGAPPSLEVEEAWSTSETKLRAEALRSAAQPAAELVGYGVRLLWSGQLAGDVVFRTQAEAQAAASEIKGPTEVIELMATTPAAAAERAPHGEDGGWHG